ncbi:MAG: gamma-glutamyltransferase [Acidiferrobacterales bacterium]|nr:gamma-glutamyltransferase [Acidiferrobacterales bacterium]
MTSQPTHVAGQLLPQRCQHVRIFVFLWLVIAPLTGLGATAKPGTAALATAHPLATEAGRAILEQGGNAFDAAVAIAATLAVVEPFSSGLGGGGLWLLYRASDHSTTMIDARERAPLAATPDMYLDKDGDPIPRLSLDGPLAAAIPGAPAALAYVAGHYGRLALSRSLAPAITLVRGGFAVASRYRRLVGRRRQALKTSPAAARVFLDNGAVPGEGFYLRQPELAEVLERLAREGHAGFYDGTIAEQLVKGVRATGGIWTLKDLTSYRVQKRSPVQGRYRQLRVTSAALPSSGGIVLMQMLNILQGFDLARLARPVRTHVIIESMRRAYHDRARYLGDSDFVDVDVQQLLDSRYATELRATIDLRRATESDVFSPAGSRIRGTQTSHFSVIDGDGNRVAATLTINTAFGSAFMPPGTGVLLNNEMDDFVIKPGVPNAYGLVGSEANAIAPGKRPLSSMTPTFLESPEAVVILGTPGGSRIITMVLLATLEVAERRGGPHDWVTLHRFHHQYLPDQVSYEPDAFGKRELKHLQALGHRLEERRGTYGNMQIVVWYKSQNRLEAVSDPRGDGAAWVGRPN